MGLYNGQLTSQVNGDIDSVLAAQTIDALLVAGRITDPCEPLLFYRTPQLSVTSTPPAYNACMNSTGTWAKRVALLVKMFGPWTATAMTSDFVARDTGQPAPPPTTLDPLRPQDSSVVPSPIVSDADADRVGESMLSRVPTTDPQTAIKPSDDVRTIARQCLKMTTRYAADLTDIQGVMLNNPCSTMPIFVPGGDVEEAAQQDLDAITLNPAWIKLNYLKSDRQTGRRDWYDYQAICTPNDLNNESCDEYPFYASRQGGENSRPVPNVQLVNKDHNSGEGNKYAGFLLSCKLSSAPPPAPGVSMRTGGDEFLVVPLPDLLRTVFTCGKNR